MHEGTDNQRNHSVQTPQDLHIIALTTVLIMHWWSHQWCDLSRQCCPSIRRRLHKKKNIAVSGSTAYGIWERVLGLTDYFGQFLSPQWNTGKFSADSAESSTQDPLGFFAVGRVVLVRIEKGWRHGNPNESFKRGILNLAPCLFWGLRALLTLLLAAMSIYKST